MNPNRRNLEEAKKRAAVEAVKHVADGFVIGLGSGSTAAYAIEEIGSRVKNEKLRVLAVPTSYQAFMLAAEHMIPITTLNEHPVLDLTIDGADQIDGDLNMIKGMGGALLREKVVASTSKKLIIAADESKKVKVLGENCQPVPVEVLPFSAKPSMLKIKEIGGAPTIREGKGKVGPVITDNGNIIMDVNFGLIETPAKLEKRLKSIPGILETGIFVGMARTVYIGTVSGIERIERE